MNIKCLAFADDLAILTNNREEARHAIEKLYEIAQKTGLQISFQKTQFIERSPSNNFPMVTRYGNVSRVPHFKYLGEIIEPSGLNLIANQTRIKKLQKAYRLTWNHYNKKSISVKAKIRHYNTVVLPEVLYAAETTVIHGQTKISDIEKQERKVLQKIFGPVRRDGIWIKRPTSEIYKHSETITINFRKRRAKFYGHIYRMEQNRITKRLFDITKLSKNKSKWLNETEEDLRQMKITENDMKDRTKFRNIINKHKFEQNLTVRRKGKEWTEERKRKHSEHMKRVWEERKNKRGTS